MSAILKLLKGSGNSGKKPDNEPVILGGAASLLLTKGGASAKNIDLAELSKPIDIGEKPSSATPAAATASPSRDRALDEHRKSLRRNSARRSHTVTQEITINAASGNADAMALQVSKIVEPPTSKNSFWMAWHKHRTTCILFEYVITNINFK